MPGPVNHQFALAPQLAAHASARAPNDNHNVEPLGWNQEELLALVAHELRGPLAAMQTALEAFQRCNDDRAAREFVQGVLVRQTQQLSSMVEEILHYARLKHGKVSLERRPVELAEVAARACALVQPRIEERGHRVELSFPAAPMVLLADQNLFVRMLANLLENAANYTDPGGWIRLAVDQADDEIVIRINDNGIGIAPDAIAHVFDLFYQSSRTMGPSGRGLGLGLAFVREIVAMHGGVVSAASAGIGRGSEFVVRFPSLKSAQVAPAVRNGASAQPGADSLRHLAPKSGDGRVA
jgi:signal transduction histidine kinase